MCFVDKEYHHAAFPEKFPHTKDEEKCDKADLVFVSRELEHMNWMSKYIEGVLTIPEMTKMMRFHVYITIKPETNNLSSFLFWRAVTLRNRKLEKKMNAPPSLFIKLGRPNFNRLIDKICKANDLEGVSFINPFKESKQP